MTTLAQRRILRAAARKTISEGRMVMPGRFARRTHPDWILHRVAMKQDGRSLDHVEAAVLFADMPWAASAIYLGAARGWHIWEREPE